MGVLQNETLSDALKLALATGMLSPSMPCTFPGQIPTIFPAPPTCYDFMNPTTTKSFTTPNPYLSIKALQPSYVAVPLYTIVPLYALQAQAPPPQSIPPPHLLDSAFWDVVERTAERSVEGAAALAWLSSAISKAAPEKDPALPQDDQQLSSCDSFDLSSLPSIPAEDDLLRVDITELESVPSSELYLGMEDPATVVPVSPKQLSSRTRPHPPSRASSSVTTLDTLLEGYLPDEDLSVLLQIPDDELYHDPEHLGESGATPLWSSNSFGIALPTLSVA